MSKPVPLPTTIKDPTVVSIHEASHAVCALAKGIPLDFVTMAPAYDGGFGGACYVQKSYGWNLPAQLYVFLAGKVGTEIHLGRECTVEETGASYDLHLYVTQVYRLVGFGTYRDIHKDYAATRRVLLRYWPAVLAVAEALRAAPVEDVRRRHADDMSVFFAYERAPRQHYLPGVEAHRLYATAGFNFWQSTAMQASQWTVRVS